MWAFSNALTNIACVATGNNSILLAPAATSPVVSAYQQLAKFTFTAAGTNSGPVTISVGSLPPLAVYDVTGAQITLAGTISGSTYYEAVYDSKLNSNAGGFWITGGVQLFSSIGYTVVIASGNYTVLATDIRILMNKTVGAATSIILPTSASRSQPLTVKDYKGDANTHNITLVPQSGETFDGFSAAVAAANGVAVISIDGDSMTIYPLASGGWYVV